MRTTKELHDEILVKVLEQGLEHDSSSCKHCKEVASQQEEEVSEDKIYDQNALDALIAAEVEKAVSEASAELTSELDETRAANEALTSALEASKTEVEDLKTQIESRDEAARLTDLSNARAEQVREAKLFNEEQIEERKDTWAKMDEGAFEALLKDYSLVVETAQAVEDNKKVSTKVDLTRETAGEEGTESSVSPFFDTL